MLAIFAVFLAPPIGRRFGNVRGLGGALAGIAVILLVMALTHSSQTALIVCVIASGAFLGVTNTLMTQVVMESAPVPRPIASSSYSFVRFCGGAIAPYVAGKLAEHVSVQAPFYLGAGMTAISVVVLLSYRRSLVPANAVKADRDKLAAPAAATPGSAPLVVAVGGAEARRVCAMAAPLARARGGKVAVLHVLESDNLAGEDTIDLETESGAREVLQGCVAELRESGVPVAGELLHSYGSHVDLAERVLDRAAELGAAAIVVGPESGRGLPVSATAYIAVHSPTHVIVLKPQAGPLGRPVRHATPIDGRALWRAA